MSRPTLAPVTPGWRRRTAAVSASLLAVVLLAAGCSGGDGDGRPAARPAPALGAELVQLRRDEALGRVEIGVTNRSKGPVVVQTVELRIAGYSGGGVQPKDEPLPAGQQVNLPTPYGEVQCPASGEVQVGQPVAVVQVRRQSDPTSYTVTLPMSDPRDLATGIARSTCLTQRLTREVRLTFGPWRRSGSGAATVLHGTLQARLTVKDPFDVTQLAGPVPFDFLPADPGAQPLAHLTPARPRASVPVLVRQSRCDAHAIGEVKKPYEFLVWLGPPGGEQTAVIPQITDTDKAALEAVCHLGWHG